jgi:hypothetical protein
VVRVAFEAFLGDELVQAEGPGEEAFYGLVGKGARGEGVRRDAPEPVSGSLDAFAMERELPRVEALGRRLALEALEATEDLEDAAPALRKVDCVGAIRVRLDAVSAADEVGRIRRGAAEDEVGVEGAPHGAVENPLDVDEPHFQAHEDEEAEEGEL